ncbi:MAG TPA: SRPBCC family protein [Anaerolineales bacterium]
MNKTKLTAEPGKQVITSTRVFDAPRDLVFKTYTDPGLLAQWWGPSRYTTRVEVMDVKPGGRWRFIQSDGKGPEEAFHGVYHDIVPSEQIIQTFEYEGIPGHHVILETITFEDQNGKTKMTDQMVFQSLEDRDGMLQAGMEEGSTESMDRFEALLKKAVPAR